MNEEQESMAKNEQAYLKKKKIELLEIKKLLKLSRIEDMR